MKKDAVKITFLGTNGWYDTATGNTISILIEGPKEYVILDAGDGLYKIDQHIKTRKPIYLFLSHFHLDHLTGLHILAKFRFKQGLTICIPKGRKKAFDLFLNRPFTVPARELKMKTRVKEITGREFSFLKGYLPLYHSDTCMGMRFDFGGKTISYIPDTGLCDNAYKLSEKADLLIAECAMKPGMGSKDWPHLNPLTAAKLAKRSKAKKLALVHFDAEVYKTMRERKWARAQAKHIFSKVIASRDDMVILV